MGSALIVVVLAVLALAVKFGLPRTMGIEQEPEEQEGAETAQPR